MKHNILKISSVTPLPKQANAFRKYVKKGWYGLPLVLLLVMVVISCNRNALNQTKLEPKALSKQEQLAKKNEAIKDSLQKAKEATYWYLNPNNSWLQERVTGVGAGGIGFKDSVKITPEELLTTYKEHLGYLPDDTFVEKRREKMRNPSGFEISYERYYKGIQVVPEYLKIMIGEDGYVFGVNAEFKTDVDKIYQNPVITADEAVRNFKQNSGLFNKVNFEKGKEKVEVKLVLSHPVKTHGKNTSTGQIRWSTVPGSLKLFYHITLYLNQKQYIYGEAVGTNYGEVDPLTGELINVYTGFSVHVNNSVCTDFYGTKNIDLNLHPTFNKYTLSSTANDISGKTTTMWLYNNICENAGFTDQECANAYGGVDKIEILNNTTNWNCPLGITKKASIFYTINEATNFFYNKFNIDSADPIRSYPIKVYFDYLRNDCDGNLQPNAAFSNEDPNEIRYEFGNATSEPYYNFAGIESVFKNLSARDIVGHEVIHSLQFRSSSFAANGFITSYIGQSFEEANSDMWAVIYEKETGSPNNENIWHISEAVTDNKRFLRSLKNPNTNAYHFESCIIGDGQPDYFEQAPYYNDYSPCCPGNSSPNVHINNGIFNHWFYLLVSGGENESIVHSIETDDSFTILDNSTEGTKRVYALGFNKAENILKGTRLPLPTTSNLYNIVLSSINATIDLYGGNKADYSDLSNCTNELIQVVRAWRAVGIQLDVLPRGETFPPCITCRNSCETDIYINGDIETGMNCDNDPSTTIANCNCTDIPIDLDLYQYRVSPEMKKCEGVTVGGSIEILPQYGRENCSLYIFFDQNYQDNITNNNLFGGLSAGTYLVQLQDGNNTSNYININVTVPKKEIWVTTPPVISTTDHPTGSLTVNLATNDILEFSWYNNDVNPIVPFKITNENTINVIGPGNYSVTVKFAGTDCIYGTFNATVDTKPKPSSGGNCGDLVTLGPTPFRVNPSPFKNETVIEIELPEEEFEVQLNVYNAQGKPVETLLNGKVLEKGVHQIKFDGSKLPKGVYIFELVVAKWQCRTAKPQTKTIKVIKY